MPSTSDPAPASSDNASAELTAVVDELLDQLQSKFQGVSKELMSRMDDMSKRIDALEATIQSSERKSGDGK